MKYEIILDENNYVSGIIHNGNEKDIYDDEFIFNTFYKDGHRVNCYKKVDDDFVLDEEKEKEIIEKETKDGEIARLKDELNSTDYKIIKCSEYQLAQLEAPYDVAELHASRQAIRDKINELENS